MAATQVDRPSFFELFKEHCSDSDLGPISLNWFEELTAEALPYEPTTCQDESRVDCVDENAVKTPTRKACPYSQLDSTPVIFKEPVLASPLFLSPTDFNKSQLVPDNRNTNISMRSPSIQTHHLPNRDYSPSASLYKSPAIIKELFKTPKCEKRFVNRTSQRDGKSDMYDSLFCTPKLMRNQTLCISESLGAEVDSEMSWSSSLATPPSPTVIISKGNEQISRPKIYDSKTAVIVQSLFSKLDNGDEKNPLALPPEMKAQEESSYKASESMLKSKLLNNINKDAVTPSSAVKAPWKQTVANAVQDKDVYQTVENVLDGMEDVLSIFFTNEKSNNLRKGKIDRVRRKICAKPEVVVPQSQQSAGKNALIPLEMSENQAHCKTLTKESLSVYEWSQLNLCERNTSQLEQFSLSTGEFTDSTRNKFQELHKVHSHSEKTNLRDYTATGQAPKALVSTSNVHRSDGFVSDVLTVEYTNTTCGKRVTVTKNSYVNLINQSCTLQQNIPKEQLGMDILNNVPQLKHVSVHQALDACSMEESVRTQWDDSTIGITHGENQMRRTMLSTLKRQAKFLYSVNGRTGQKDRKDTRLSSSDDHSCALEKPGYQDNGEQYELQLHRKEFEHEQTEDKYVGKEDGSGLRNDIVCFQENERNQPSVKPADREPYAPLSPCHIKMNRSDIESRSRTPSNLKIKMLVTAGLLARKPLMVEMLSRQHGKQSPQQNKDVLQNNKEHNSALTCSQTQKGQVQSNELWNRVCNTGHNPVTEEEPKQPGPSSLLSSEITIPSNQLSEEEALLDASPSAVLESKRVGREESGNKCSDFEHISQNPNLFGFAPNGSLIDSSLSDTKLQSKETHTCISKDIEINILPDCQPSNSTVEHTISISGGQSVTQPALVVNKKARTNFFVCNTDLLEKGFEGFKTASDKKIEISKTNLMKGEALFKEIDAQCLVTDFQDKTEEKKASLETTTYLHIPASAVNFKGFKTAANKEIIVSDNTLAKGRLLFNDLDDESSEMPVRTKECKTSQLDLVSKAASNIILNTSKGTFTTEKESPESLDRMPLQQNSKDSKQRNMNDISLKNLYPLVEAAKYDVRMMDQRALCGSSIKAAKKPVFCNPSSVTGNRRNEITKNVSTRILPNFNSVLTESQKAEVSELSSLLEGADSQYEFTQFRKVPPVSINIENRQSLNESAGESQNLNNSEVWKDVDFNDSFAVGGESLEGSETDTNVCKIPQEKRGFCDHKNDVAVSVATTFSESSTIPFGGFSLASGKSINIAPHALLKAIEVFGDIEEGNELYNHTPKEGRECPPLHPTSTSTNLCNVNSDYKSLEDKGGCSEAPSVPKALGREVKVQLNINKNRTEYPFSESIDATEQLKASSEWLRNDKALHPPNICTELNKGFQTASGKNIKFSQSSLDKVQHVFEDNDNFDGFSVQSDENKPEAGVQSVGSKSSGKSHVEFKPVQDPRWQGKSLSHGSEGKELVMGFSTAGGKKVSVSTESLARVRNLFQEECHLGKENKTSVREKKELMAVSCVPLGTEMGHSDKDSELVHVPEPKLDYGYGLISTTENLPGFQKPKMSTFNETNRNLPPKCSSAHPVGFSTAKGKNINIDKLSLLKAGNIFKDISDMTDVAMDGHSVDMLNIPGSIDFKDNMSENKCVHNNVNHLGNLSEDAHMKKKDVGSLKITYQTKTEGSSAQVQHMPQLPTFSTASGKTVSVSHKSYEKAKLIFSEIVDEPVPDHDHSAQPGLTRLETERERGAVSHVQGQRSKLSPLLQESTRRSNVDKPKCDVLQPTVCPYSEPQTQSRPDTNPQSKAVTNMFTTEQVVGPSKISFSTAPLSEASLRKATALLSETDCEQLTPQERDNNTSAKDGSPKHIQARMAKENEIKASKDTYPLNRSTNKNSFGFSTASGRKVAVSDAALQKARCMLQEFDDLGNLIDVKPLNVKNAPAEIDVSTPMLKTETASDNSNPCQSDNPNLMHSEAPIRSCPLAAFRKHSTPSHNFQTFASNVPKPHLHFTVSHTPENDFDLEAAESAKAFMDDEDLMDTGLKSDSVFSSSTKGTIMRGGKRLRSEEGMPRGEPPIKRQLLPEFDRATENQPKLNLKPLTSSPTGTMKDRRKFLYSTTLKPLVSNPSRSGNGSSDCTRQLNSTVTDHVKPVIKTFIPPFKKKLDTFTDVQAGDIHRPSSYLHKTSTMAPIQENDVHAGASLTDHQDSESDALDLLSTLHCAKDLQEMRIRKKQRQRIKPQPGSLYIIKTSSTARIPLVSAVHRKRPATYSKEQLYIHGVVKTSLGITSENAASFQFHCMDHFTKHHLLSGNGVRIADGGWLVPTDRLKAGKDQFYGALCDTPGVDPKLISPEWVCNHYRWIIWKLAALEVRFPEVFGSRCLTPERVLLQLKYRYDLEIDKSQRSAIRKIMERDDTPAKTLVLCIAKIICQGTSLSNQCSNANPPEDIKQGSAVIEVTDGWYGIKALLDPALTALLHKGRLFIGQKIITHGTELVGSDEACTPLEAPESVMLKLAANSTRPAAWHAKLGYFQDPRPFCLRLSSLFSEGGIVGFIDVLIQRIYPVQYMEKMTSGLYVFRNERAEEKEAERYAAKQQKNLEALFTKIQEAFEQQEAWNAKGKGLGRRSLNRAQICALQDGAEIYQAIQNESDPGYLESFLSSEQLRALNHHRQGLNDKKQAHIQAEFRKAIESSEQGPAGCAKREVTAVVKMRIVDYRDLDRDTAYMLNIWRPLPDVLSLLKEGSRFKMYNLSTSKSKSKSETADVQLTATKKTCYQQLQSSQDVLDQIYRSREAAQFSSLLDPSFRAAYREVDVVGLVISAYKKSGAAPVVYLSDESHNLLAVKFWTDLGQLALEELTKPRTFITASNLCWRSECISGLPTLYAGDLSIISSNPKDSHLQKAIQRLRHSVQCMEEFFNEAVAKLMKLLQVDKTLEKLPLANYIMEPCTPTWKMDVAGSRRLITPSHSGGKTADSACTPDLKTSLSACSVEIDPKACKKLKGLDFLGRIPSPPPLTPVRPFISPYIQKAFRPPRSCSTPEDCTQIKKRTVSIHKTTRLPTDSTANAEGGFVADEELAMINTQVLVSGLAGGKMNTMPSNDLQKGNHPQKPTSDANTADTLQSASSTSNDLNNTMKKEGLLLGQRTLQRKRKQRL
ncbi:breast cancer type 2 susceptibility protein [Pelodytes ibericus]